MTRHPSAREAGAGRFRTVLKRVALIAAATPASLLPRSGHGRSLVVAGLSFAAIVLIAYGGLYLRLSQGPIPFSFLNERIVGAVQEGVPEALLLTIGSTVLERDPRSGNFQVSMIDVAAVDAEGETKLAAPRATVRLSWRRLLAGRVTPRTVWLIEPDVTLIESESGLLALSATASAPQLPGYAHSDTATALMGGLGGALALFSEVDGLQEIGVRDGRISVVGVDGEISALESISMSAAREQTESRLGFRAHIGHGTGRPRLNGTLSHASDGDFEILLRFNDVAPSDLGPFAPRGLADVFTSPVSSDLTVRLSSSGALEALSGRMLVGAGHVGTGRMSVLVDEADLAFHWNQSSGRIVIEPSTVLAGYNRGTVSGEIVIPDPGEFDYGTVPVRLELKDVSFGDPLGGPAAVYPLVTLEALYIRREGVLHVSRLDVVATDAAMSFVGYVGGSGGESPAVRLAGSMLPVPYEAFRDLWPPFLGPKTRQWVIQHLTAGRISNARLTVDIPPGAIAAALRGVPLPDSAYLLEFGLDDVYFGYLGEMPPISGARGYAELTPRTFDLRMEPGAQIVLDSGESAEVGAGRFRIADRRVISPTGDISLELSGSASVLLRLFDHPPLEIAKRRNLDVSGVSGQGALSIDMNVPLVENVRFSDIGLRIDGHVKNFSARNFHGAREVTNGDVRIGVADGRVVVAGSGLLDGVPAEIAVDESLDENGVAGDTSVTMTLDAAARNRLGIRLDDVLSGPVTATVSGIEPTSVGTVQRIEADLTAARIDLPYLGLDKPAGEPATASFLLTQDASSVRLSELSLESGAIRVSGGAEFSKDGEILTLDFPVVRTARGTDLSVSGRSGGEGLVLMLRGDSLDLRDGLRNLRGLAAARPASAEAANGGKPVRIEVEVATAQGLHGQSLSSVNGSITQRGGEISRLNLSGMTAGGAPVQVRYVDTGGTAELAAETPDAGRLLAWSGLYANLRSGRLRLTAFRRGEAAPLAGNLVIEGFSIADDRSLARLISSGERDVQAQVDRPDSSQARRRVNPGNVGFDALAVPFARTTHGIRISDGVLRGPAVGATLDGEVDLRNERLTLRGTYVPLYEINNLFGRLPLVGPLLGGRRNEGLLGITYSLAGTLDEPVLTVNPLSVVAPGVFRYILGMDNPRAFAAPADASRSSAPGIR
jgi:hypothetical protein